MSLEKILKGTIKLAAVCLTAPATLAVASTLYADWGAWRWVTAAAALLLVEGALLLGWHLLDSQGKTATGGQRSLYAALVIVAYVVLWAIALAHNEGLAGIAFRATLGVLIAYSLAEAGILAGLRQDSAVLRDATRDRKVRRHQKQLAVKDAVASLDTEYAIKAQQRANWQAEQSKALELEHSSVMSSLRKPKEANTENGTRSFPYPIGQARDKRQDQRLTRKQQALDMIVAARKARPDLTQQELADLVGVSRQSISSYLRQLAGAGDGQKQQLSFVIDESSNGNGSH